MAKGTAPLFSTAPRIEIYIGDSKIAYAIGLNLNVSVDIQPVRIVGQFGPVSLEPTRYNPVTGTMQIIRLASSESFSEMEAARNGLIANGKFTDTNVTAKTYNDKGESTESVDGVVQTEGQVLQGSLYQHLDPAQVLISRAFDVKLKMRIPDSTNAAVQNALGVDGSNQFINSSEGLYTSVDWLKIVNCRITSRNVNIAEGQLVNEPVSFQGLMATPIDANSNSLFTLDSSNKET